MGSRFVWEEGDLEVPQCSGCVYYRGNKMCLAFPAGIPDDIFSNKYDHLKPYFGDGGFRFTPAQEGGNK